MNRISVTVTTYVPHETKKELFNAANKYNMSLADLLREIIRQFLEQDSNQTEKK
jgi:predicted DNA-binding protein